MSKLMLKEKVTVDHPNMKVKVYYIHREDKKAKIDKDAIEKFIKDTQAKADAENVDLTMTVRGLSNIQWFTLTDRNGNLQMESAEDYLNGRVADGGTHSGLFMQLEVTMTIMK